MCRFAFYKGKPLFLRMLLTEPEHSLINQSFQAREREEPLNGDGFGRIRRHLVGQLSDASFDAIRGTTDSEHFFALLCDELAGSPAQATSAQMADALRRAIGRVLALVERHAPGEHIYLNAVLTDGNVAVACRYTTDRQENADSLYTNSGRRYVCEDGVCRMLDPGEQNGSALMVSSEPLGSDTGWAPVPINHLIRVEPNLALVSEAVGV